MGLKQQLARRPEVKPKPLCTILLEKGLNSPRDHIRYAQAVMRDVAKGAMDYREGQFHLAGQRNILKTAELLVRYSEFADSLDTNHKTIPLPAPKREE